jgi:triphosphoribosyl-dephospho-CoA synthase
MIPSQQQELQRCIETACVWEATAPKPGNVHPARAFADLTYEDFVAAAKAAAPCLARASEVGVGRAVLDAVLATNQACRSNVNLGICLLLAPLAAVPQERALTSGIGEVLSHLTDEDAHCVYEAIRLAKPGGLGQTAEQDVSSAPTCGLLEAMRLAEDRDRIAWNYTHAFEDVLVTGPRLRYRWSRRLDRNEAIVALHLELMARIPDTLIARKCGTDVAEEASRRAAAVLDSGWPDAPRSPERLAELDGWLRADGNRRNPGTTADLVAAILFVVLRVTRNRAAIAEK